MSTRSAIGMMNPDGRVRAVYCHWDGYPEYVGKILNEHYRNSDKIVRLLDQGDISSLDQEIGTKHDFDSRVMGECTFYRRDRGDTEEVDAETFNSVQEFLDSFSYTGVEYFYIYRQGQWFVSEGTEFFVTVDSVLEKEIANV